MVRVSFNNLFDQLWMGGFQIRCGWLIQFKFKTSPQVRHVKYLVPVAANLRSMSPIKKRQILKHMEDNVLQEIAPVTVGRTLTCSPQFLGVLCRTFLWWIKIAISSSFHPSQKNASFFKLLHILSIYSKNLIHLSKKCLCWCRQT